MIGGIGELLKKYVSVCILVTVIFSLTMSYPTFLTLAAETLPTVWVEVFRIQAVDPIEGFLEGAADWRYKITVSDGETSLTEDYKCPSNDDDIVVDRVDTFGTISNKDVSVTISLFEDDTFGSETADISSSGNSFFCIYHLKTDEFEGDDTVFEEGHYKTSGDYDGSIYVDQNDANLWFLIYDNYDAPLSDAGGDQYCFTGDKINFDSSGSKASDGSSLVKYQWDFENDGVFDAEGEQSSYTYEQKGLQTCRLRVTDSIGEWDEDFCLVNVQNRDPEGQFTYSPLNPNVKVEVNFVDTSSDFDGTLVSWFWDFGDGTNSTLQSPIHTFIQKGDNLVKLTVADNDGAENMVSHTIVVINLPPEADFECVPADPHTDGEVQFSDISVDPENLPFSSWLWDFGDGYTSDLQNPTHKFSSEGSYDVTLTVSDDENATSIFSMTISVTEPSPTEAAIPIPLWMIVLIIAIVLAVSIIGFYVWNRGRISRTA